LLGTLVPTEAPDGCFAAGSGDVVEISESYGCGWIVVPLAVTMVEAMATVKRMGIGSAKILGAADLAIPKGA